MFLFVLFLFFPGYLDILRMFLSILLLILLVDLFVLDSDCLTCEIFFFLCEATHRITQKEINRNRE